MKRRKFIAAAAAVATGAAAGCLGGDDCPPVDTDTPEPTPEPPETAFEYDYNYKEDTLEIRHAGEFDLVLDRVSFEVSTGETNVVSRRLGGDDDWVQGEWLTLGDISPDSEVDIVWTKDGHSTTIGEWRVRPPEAEFQFQHYPAGDLAIQILEGDTFSLDNVEFRGSSGNDIGVSEARVNDHPWWGTGEIVVVTSVDHGETVEIIWEDGGTAGVIGTHTTVAAKTDTPDDGGENTTSDTTTTDSSE